MVRVRRTQVLHQSLRLGHYPAHHSPLLEAHHLDEEVAQDRRVGGEAAPVGPLDGEAALVGPLDGEAAQVCPLD